MDFTYYNTNTYNQLFSSMHLPAPVTNVPMSMPARSTTGVSKRSWVTRTSGATSRVDQRQLLDEPQQDQGTRPRGDARRGRHLITIDEVNMDYGGYRMKIKEGGSIGDFYGRGSRPTTKGASMSTRIPIPSPPIPTRGFTAAIPKPASAWGGTTGSPTRA